MTVDDATLKRAVDIWVDARSHEDGVQLAMRCVLDAVLPKENVNLVELIRRQREVLLRIEPDVMDPILRMSYIKTYTLATVAELMEALDETPWKTWSVSGEINTEQFFAELRDVWQFITDLMILAYPHDTDTQLAQRFQVALEAKWPVNVNRAENGYDGRNKCPGCGRALDDPTTPCGEPGDLHGLGRQVYCVQKQEWFTDVRTGDDLRRHLGHNDS